MEIFTSDDLEICLIEAKFLTLDAVDSEEVTRVVDTMLQKVTDSNNHQDLQTLAQIAQYLKDLAIAHPAVKTSLLNSLDGFKQPAPFLDVLPEMFSSASPESIIELAKKLFDFASNDHLFVLTLAVLVELPLDAQLSMTTMKNASEAIHRVEPSEYSTLFKVTLKAAGGKYGHSIIKAWRKKVTNVCDVLKV